MSKLASRWLRAALALALFAGAAPARADEEAATPDFERTPPRLSFTDGEVSFWRSGADDWSPAQVNTPLGDGDQLYAGAKANLEIQIGARAFVRAGEETQLGLTNLEPDFLQFRIVTGHASLDLRSVKAGTTVEIDTPHGAFTVEHQGYYRIEVSDESTRFTSRRGGRATVTPANGHSAAIASSETLVISGTDQPQLETYAASELDDWDRWNYTRTDQQLDAVSSRYVPYGVYGVDDLDHYGDWRVVPTYGSIWVPRVAVGWVPYSTGSWMYDPYYGWSWVDASPWGWAPFHYGRWVSVGGYWGWAPGPLVARPYYSPALVAFYGSPGFSVGVGFGYGYRSWVALGWGEPCVTWWGPRGWRGTPRWNGWGGPRIVNNVVINNTTVVNVNDVHGWANAGRKGAVVGVPREQFGRGRMKVEHFDSQRVAKLRPMRGELDVKPEAASLAPSTERGQRPPRGVFERSVVATREPKRDAPASFQRTIAPTREDGAGAPKSRGIFGRNKVTRDESDGTAARVVTAPKRDAATLRNRPPFGKENTVERSTPPKPPRFGETRARDTGRNERAVDEKPSSPEVRIPARVQEPSRERTRAERVEIPAAPQRDRTAESRGREPRVRETAPAAPAAPRELPGEPANRVLRGRDQPEMHVPRNAEPQRAAPQERGSQRSRQREQPQVQDGGGQPPASVDAPKQGGGQSRGGDGGGWGRGRGDR